MVMFFKEADLNDFNAKDCYDKTMAKKMTHEERMKSLLVTELKNIRKAVNDAMEGVVFHIVYENQNRELLFMVVNELKERGFIIKEYINSSTQVIISWDKKTDEPVVNEVSTEK